MDLWHPPTSCLRSGALPEDLPSSTIRRSLKTWLYGKGRQMEFVGPAGLVLGVQVVEGPGVFDGVHQQLRMLLCKKSSRQTCEGWRRGKAAYAT